MAEFTVVAKIIRCMCKSYDTCHECELFTNSNNGICNADACLTDGCSFMKADEVEAVAIKWEAAHPELRYPTWDEWQKSICPTKNHPITPCSFMSITKLDCPNTQDCEACRNKVIPADVAEKLGIQPRRKWQTRLEA